MLDITLDMCTALTVVTYARTPAPACILYEDLLTPVCWGTNIIMMMNVCGQADYAIDIIMVQFPMTIIVGAMVELRRALLGAFREQRA